MNVIRIPKRFYDDCEDCETQTPPIVKKTKRHYFVDIDCEDPDVMLDFKSRAELYCETLGWSDPKETIPICLSARATMAAILKGEIA
jgi:uncharacterized protein YqkB